MEPKNNIRDFKIRINADYCFNLYGYYASTEIYPQNITNLKANITYYFHFHMEHLQHANITLSMNKMPSKPFKKILISYYESKSNSFPIKYSSQILSFEEENNKLSTNFTIHNNISNAYFFTVKFKPLYDIDKICAILEIGGVPPIEYKTIYFNSSRD